MTDRNSPQPTSETKAMGTGERKVYVKPAWEVEQVFEKAALGCVKADDGACGPGPIQS